MKEYLIINDKLENEIEHSDTKSDEASYQEKIENDIEHQDPKSDVSGNDGIIQNIYYDVDLSDLVSEVSDLHYQQNEILRSVKSEYEGVTPTMLYGVMFILIIFMYFNRK